MIKLPHHNSSLDLRTVSAEVGGQPMSLRYEHKQADKPTRTATDSVRYALRKKLLRLICLCGVPAFFCAPPPPAFAGGDA
eukprot:32349-Eustigmatos_ZCMA.PRE.1